MAGLRSGVSTYRCAGIPLRRVRSPVLQTEVAADATHGRRLELKNRLTSLMLVQMRRAGQFLYGELQRASRKHNFPG